MLEYFFGGNWELRDLEIHLETEYKGLPFLDATLCAAPTIPNLPMISMTLAIIPQVMVFLTLKKPVSTWPSEIKQENPRIQ